MLPQCNAIEPSAENRPFGRKVRPLKDLTACRARPPPLEMAHAEHVRVAKEVSDKLFWHQIGSNYVVAIIRDAVFSISLSGFAKPTVTPARGIV